MSQYIVNTMEQFFGLKGKTAIVTGAANGIGEETAKLLAGLGANVVVCDIEETNLARVVDEVTAAGGSILGVPCNVTKDEEIQNAVEKTLAAFGTIDVLVNNAAGCGGGITIDTITDKEWTRLIDLNLTAVYKFIMAVLPTMRKNKKGSICNISSGAAIMGEPTDVHYAAAKGGVISMTKELAWELGAEGITLNVVAPGVTMTRMAPLWEQEMQYNKIPRVGVPMDIASSIAFVVSDAGSYFTGQVLCPNGGAWM